MVKTSSSGTRIRHTHAYIAKNTAPLICTQQVINEPHVRKVIQAWAVSRQLSW